MKKSKLILIPFLALLTGTLSSCDAANQIASMATDIQSQITDLQSDVDSLKNQVNELKKQISDLESEMDENIAKVEADYTAKIKVVEDNISALQKDINDLTAKLEADKKELADDYNEKIANLKTTHDADIASIRAGYDAELVTLKNNYDSKLASLESDYKAQIVATKEEYDAKLAALETDYKNKINAAKEEYDTKIANLKADYDGQIASMSDDYNTKINNFQATYQTKVAEIEGSIATERARITALQTEMANQVVAIQNDYNSKINTLTGRVATLESVQYHTVSFDTKGGNDIASVVVIHGEKVKKPADPTKAGSTFKGWTYQDEPWRFNGSVVTEDMILTANWEQINYTATFLNDDGSIISTLENVHYGETATFQGATPIKPNQEEHYAYSFTGWDKDLTITGDMTFTAQYSKEYLPYQEKFLGADGSVILSRYVQENDGYITLTQGEDYFESIDGLVYLEFEDALLRGDGNIWEADNSRGKKTVANTNTTSSMEYHIECSRNVSAMLGYCGAALGAKWNSLSYYFSLFVNDVEVEIPESSKMTYCDDWDNWELADVAMVNLKKGDNKILFQCKNGINHDYFTLAIDTFDITKHGVAQPFKLNEGTLMYQFKGWNLVSNENDVATYSPIFEQATIGLEFDGNKVDVYHGEATEVFVPAYWNKENIKRIGYSSFGGTNVVNVHLPETITDIEYNAFYDCKKLTTINFPSSLRNIGHAAFQFDSKLADVVLNDGIEKVEYAAFEGTGIVILTIPDSMRILGDNAFGGLNAEFIFVPGTIESIDWHCFYSPTGRTNVVYTDRAYRPSNWHTNWALACKVVWGYESMVEEDGYKYAIATTDGHTKAILVGYNKNKTSFELPAKVNNIPVEAMYVNFKQNKIIQNVVLPNFVTEIDDNMFFEATNLQSITLSNNLKTIGERAFYGCSKLEAISFPDGLESIGFESFYDCYDLGDVVIPNSVTEILQRAFHNCDSMENITLPNGIETLLQGVLEECDNLDNLIIPASVKKIEGRVCYNLPSLKTLYLPNSLEEIEEEAFGYCWNIQKTFFGGTQEEFNSIVIGPNGNNNVTGKPIYYYSETEPAVAGNYWHYVAGVATIWA